MKKNIYKALRRDLKSPQHNDHANLIMDFFPSFNGQSEE